MMRKLLLALLLINIFFIATAANNKTQHQKSKIVLQKPKTLHVTKHIVRAKKVPAKKIKKTNAVHKKSAQRIKPVLSANHSAAVAINNDNNPQPRLYSRSVLAIDAHNGEILINKNSNAKLPIASITKLMMAIVLLDSGVNLDQYVMITEEDVDKLKHTFSRLRVGMQLRRRDLLLLALMSSENRAAYALGRTTYPGGTKIFIQKMNQKAQSLGMLHTRFYDSTGLTHANQSTAFDLILMVKAAFSYKLIREFSTTKGADVLLGSNYIHHYVNSDALVRNGNLQIELSKTGFINEAGHCLVLYSIIKNRPIIMIFLNSSGKSGRLLDAITVKNYIQQYY